MGARIIAVAALALLGADTCGVTPNGYVACGGSNEEGQLGITGAWAAATRVALP